jgi:hypothetical protein
MAVAGIGEAPVLAVCNQLPCQVRDLRTRRPKVKVFWFFSSEKNKILLFLKKKKQKDFYFLVVQVRKNRGVNGKRCASG